MSGFLGYLLKFTTSLGKVQKPQNRKVEIHICTIYFYLISYIIDL